MMVKFRSRLGVAMSFPAFYAFLSSGEKFFSTSKKSKKKVFLKGVKENILGDSPVASFRRQ